MKSNTSLLFSMALSAVLLTGCGGDDSSSQSAGGQPSETMPPPEVQQEQVMEHARESAGAMMGEEKNAQKETMQEGPVYIENGVIYQEEIYRNWPYTEGPSAENGSEPAAMSTEVKSSDNMQAAAPETHIINAEARIFKPDILYINPGDTVHWQNMTSHNTVSVEGMIPEGADPWRGALGENLQVTLDVEGIYAYVCEPHIGFGMVGLIIVGHPTTLDEVKKYAQENLQGPYRRLLGKLIKVKL